MNPPTVPERPPIIPPTSTPLQSVVPPFAGSSQSKPQGNKKMLLSILAVVILTMTTISGIFLIARPVLFKSSAWNCGAYTFSISSGGVVTVRNDSTSNEDIQRANVFINNQQVETFDVPALNAGASATLGTVTVPTTSFSWQVVGTSDCSNSGNITLETSGYQCQNLKAYSSDGTSELTAAQLKSLKEGDQIRVVAKGSGLGTRYTAAKFVINGVEQTEVTTKTSSGDYFMTYQIPANTTNFQIKAQLKASDGNWY